MPTAINERINRFLSSWRWEVRGIFFSSMGGGFFFWAFPLLLLFFGSLSPGNVWHLIEGLGLHRHGKQGEGPLLRLRRRKGDRGLGKDRWRCISIRGDGCICAGLRRVVDLFGQIGQDTFIGEVSL